MSDISEAKQYDKSYKEQEVKLAGQIETKSASEELKVSHGTLYRWVQSAKKGELHIDERTPDTKVCGQE